MHCNFDNANQERYQIKKSKINEFGLQSYKFNIKSIILFVYIYYLICQVLSIYFKNFEINFQILLTFIIDATIMTKNFNCESSL